MTSFSDKFSVRQAVIEDAPFLIECALNGFINACPHAKAFKFTREHSYDLFRWIVESSLYSPYSVVVYDKATGKLAGFNLYSVSHRENTKDFEPFMLDVASMPENMQIHERILDNLKQKMWSFYPHVEKVLHQEVAFVDPRFQRQGIAGHLTSLLNIEQLKVDGFGGIQSEATSYANQQLLTKFGYKKLSETNPKDYYWSDGSPIILPDETKSMELFFLPFN